MAGPAAIHDVSWSPGGRHLVWISADPYLRFYDHQDDSRLLEWRCGDDWLRSVCWLSDRLFACAGDDGKLYLLDFEARTTVATMLGHTGWVLGLARDPVSGNVASAGADKTVRIWDLMGCRQMQVLEGHTAKVASVAFTADGGLLASRSVDGEVRFWRTDTWSGVGVHTASSVPDRLERGLDRHPERSAVAVAQRHQRVASIWSVDAETLREANASDDQYYRNAKVVLVGETGVGKSGLALVLCGQPFAPTLSTHGRRIATFQSEVVRSHQGETELQETLLWDLAGQIGYRLIHQLHLHEASVAIVVVDAGGPRDAIESVRHWDRALRQVRRFDGDAAARLRKLLVVARSDNGVTVDRQALRALCRELGFEAYLEVSAKEGWGIPELRETIRRSIDWSTLGRITSNKLFRSIRTFVDGERAASRHLLRLDELYRSFVRSTSETGSHALSVQFEACIDLLQGRGLVRRLSFGDFVLLRPELLDAYAMAMFNGARDNLGSVREAVALAGDLPIPKDERVAPLSLERPLLMATVEEMLRYEIVLREVTDTEILLVFPAEITHERPSNVTLGPVSQMIEFRGLVVGIYATLIVRLTHSDFFEKLALWRDGALFKARAGGTCGLILRRVEDGGGQLQLFFEGAAEAARHEFEEMIVHHLERRAIPESVRGRRSLMCTSCGASLDFMAETIERQSFSRIFCPACGAANSVTLETGLRLPRGAIASGPDRQRDTELADSIIRSKVDVKEFDVFLAHNHRDRDAVASLSRILRSRALNPWLDVERIPPGRWFQDIIQKAISMVRSAAIVVGKDGVGKWEAVELRAFISECVERDLAVIPVLLPGVAALPRELLFLRGLREVRFVESLDETTALDDLVFGITGHRGAHIAA